jgi:outer membrane cobalamin receptor
LKTPAFNSGSSADPRSIALFCLLLLFQSFAAAQSGRFLGRPVAEVLRELRGPNIEFVFSSALVGDDVRVASEPVSRDPVEMAREILRPHGLALREPRPGLYTVVREGPGVQSRISGRIIDAVTLKPVSRARIEVEGADGNTSSDASGAFAIQASTGQVTLKVFATEYLAGRIERVSPGTTELEIRLQPIPIDEVVVSASRYAAGDTDSTSTFLLEGTRLAAQPSIANDPVRVLARLPGIAQSGASAQSNVRGGEATEVLILLDGFRLRQAFHLPGYQSFFSVLDSGLIRETEVFTGGFPARYGNRLSGVFDLRTIDAATPPRRSIGVDFFNATGRVSDVLTDPVKGDWLISARIGTLQPLMDAFAPKEGSPAYGDVYSRVGFQHGDLKSSANFLWARDEFKVDSSERGERADLQSRSRYLWWRSDWNPDGDWSAYVTLGHSSMDLSRVGTVDAPQPGVGQLEDVRIAKFWDLRAVGSWQASDRHGFEAGFEWTDESADYRYASTVSYPSNIAALFDRDAQSARTAGFRAAHTRSAFFASHRWRITPAITSELGLRGQHFEATGVDAEWNVDPRINVRWRLNEATDLRVHWGRFHQSDESHELQIEEETPGFRPPQRSDHTIVGIERRIGAGTSVRLEGFRKRQSAPRPRYENVFDTLALLPELSPDRVRIEPDGAEFLGIETSILHRREPWTYWAGLTWSEAFDQFAGDDVPRTWDQRWQLKTGADWARGRWAFSAVLDVHSGWATTALTTDPQGNLVIGPRNEERLSPYATLDLRGEYRRALQLGELRVGFQITNATNRNNECCLQLKLDADGTLQPESRQWLPLLPSLSVRWEF